MGNMFVLASGTLLILQTLLSVSHAAIFAPCGSSTQSQILKAIFLNYDKDARPPPGDNATLVLTNTQILNIDWVNETSRQWRVNLYFRQIWRDSRLQFGSLDHNCQNINYLSLTTVEAVNRVWKPNLFFFNEVDSFIHQVIQPNVLIRIYPSGTILYSVHVTATLRCTTPTSPGEIVCPMKLYPYGPTKDEIILKWQAQDPVQIDRSTVSLDNFALGDITTVNKDLVAQTGTYSVVEADFHFIRKKSLPYNRP